MKSVLLKVMLALALAGLSWSQPHGGSASITTPDGKTVIIQPGDPGDQVGKILTSFLRGSQNGKLVMRWPGQVMELVKKDRQVTYRNPQGGWETGSAEVFLQGFLSARVTGLAKACENNLKNIATALEMYAEDHHNSYPDNLKQLTSGKYLRTLPTCPAAHRDTYTVTYRKSGQTYELHCSGSHPGRAAGHPSYSSRDGLTP